jgi:uncharacterized protein DUF3140
MTEQDDVRSDFDEVVNMTPKQLEEWLKTEESPSVGWGEASRSGTSPGSGLPPSSASAATSSTDYDAVRRAE